jgi:hypothetical protein
MKSYWEGEGTYNYTRNYQYHKLQPFPLRLAGVLGREME